MDNAGADANRLRLFCVVVDVVDVVVCCLCVCVCVNCLNNKSMNDKENKNGEDEINEEHTHTREEECAVCKLRQQGCVDSCLCCVFYELHVVVLDCDCCRVDDMMCSCCDDDGDPRSRLCRLRSAPAHATILML